MAKSKMDANPSSSYKDTNKKKKKIKNLLSAPAAAAMKSSSKNQQPTKANPFEVMWSRKKFDILGKKRKEEGKRIGQIRSNSIEKRKKTLQKEYEESNKSSVFIDKRIGEYNDNIPEHEKAILRIQRKYQLKAKKSKKYNLEDDDEGGYFAIPLNDDFNEHVASDEDDNLPDGSTSSKYLNLHAGDYMPENDLNKEAGENVHKSKKQVMAEIILKSKFYKAQKAKDKEADEKLMDKLDHDFASLAQNEALASLTQPTKMNALKAIANISSTGLSVNGSSASVGKEPLAKEKPDAYDKLVKEMSLDMRARPSDRTKTPEEIAQEERERLETLEEERRKRMQTTYDSSDEDKSDNEDHDLRRKKLNAVSGDDLGDSFSVNEAIGNTTAYEKENTTPDEEDSSPEGSESDEDQDGTDDDSDDDDHVSKNLEKMSSIKDWEQSDDDDVDLDDEEADDAIEKELARRNIDVEELKNSSAKKEKLPKQEALPYVIEAPNNLEELCSLLDNCSDEEVIVAINRIRACNSIRLAVENRRKMQVFYGILLQYFAVLATQNPVLYNRLNVLVKPLIEMSNETPYFAAICARQRLLHTRTRFCEDIKIPGRCSWPSMKTLLLLRLWSLIFPCSDFRHVVMTPAILLMCEYLMRCPILSGRDVAIGCFLCTMVLSVAKQSQKFCPEAIIFLQSLLASSFDSESKNSQCHHLLELQTSTPWLRLDGQTTEVHPLDFFKDMNMEADSPFFMSDNFKTSVLLSLVGTLKGFVNIYDNLSSFPEIFLPLNDLLHKVPKSDLPALLQSEVDDVINLIKKKADEHHMLRMPLQMRKQKPVPLKLLNPKFEESYVKGRDYDPDRERVERKKLKKRLKSEAKGAVRELRKDNYFIFGLKEKDRLQQEEERADKYGKARAFLQEQESAFKSGQLGKGRKRRR